MSDEFRQQIKDKFLWRSDVLQLKSTLLWAWVCSSTLALLPQTAHEISYVLQRSAERFEPPGGATGETTMKDRSTAVQSGSGDKMDVEA